MQVEVNRETKHVMSVSKVFDDLDPILDVQGGLKNQDAAVEELIRYRHQKQADELFHKINTYKYNLCSNIQ